MKIFTRMILLFFTLAFLGACVRPSSQPLTFEQEQMQMAKEQCEKDATQMNPGNPTSMNPEWNSYFTMCMNKFGYTDEQIKQLWP